MVTNIQKQVSIRKMRIQELVTIVQMKCKHRKQKLPRMASFLLFFPPLVGQGPSGQPEAA